MGFQHAVSLFDLRAKGKVCSAVLQDVNLIDAAAAPGFCLLLPLWKVPSSAVAGLTLRLSMLRMDRCFRV